MTPKHLKVERVQLDWCRLSGDLVRLILTVWIYEYCIAYYVVICFHAECCAHFFQLHINWLMHPFATFWYPGNTRCKQRVVGTSAIFFFDGTSSQAVLMCCMQAASRSIKRRFNRWMKLHGSFFLVDSCRIDVLICFIKKPSLIQLVDSDYVIKNCDEVMTRRKKDTCSSCLSDWMS